MSEVISALVQTPKIFVLCRAALAEPHPARSHQGQSGDNHDHAVQRTKGHVDRLEIRPEEESDDRDLKCMTLSRSVLNVKTGAENIGSMVLDATRDLVAVADREGGVYIHDYGKQSHPEISSFCLSDPSESAQNSVPDTVDTVALFCLDASHSVDRLIACSTDASVRVWDHCTERASCSLRSAWQAVPVCSPPSFVLAPACFDWQPSSGHLFAAGLSHPGVVQRVDLECEMLVQQFGVDKNSRPAIDFLKCFRQSPNLLAVGCADGMVRVFDVRTNCSVCGVRPFSAQGAISAMSPVHTSRGEQLCVLSYNGDMKHLDIRHSDDAILSSLVTASKNKAHSLGCTSALITHMTHPVILSATLHPVIKVWSGDGEPVSSIRPFKKYKENCQQAVTSLAFHPKDWSRFAAGGKGRTCGIYELVRKADEYHA